jgi:hypothetical protein
MRPDASPRVRPVWLVAVTAPVLVVSTGVLAADDGEPHANTVEFVNETPHTVLFIYAHMDNVTDLEDDLLGQDVLEPGQRLKVNMDLGPRRCLYEISVQLRTDGKLWYPRFDACKEATLHLTMDALEAR